MLKQRLITAAVLIPIVICLIYVVPTVVVGLVFSAMIILGALEWAKMVPCETSQSKTLFISSIVALLIFGYFVASSAAIVFFLCAIATLWWGFVLLWLFQVKDTGHIAHQDSPSGVIKVADLIVSDSKNKAIVGALTLLPCFVAIVYLHAAPDFGSHYVFFCLSLMWAADSGAYFAGKKWGDKKLAPGVSPGKTIEGVTGGVVVAAIWTLLWMFFADLGEGYSIAFFLLSLLVTLISVAGDLFESLFKRIADIKDSGHILPGHGGVLDRIDSLTAGAPIFVLGLLLL